MIFFLGVPAHLVDLRMNAAIKLNAEPVFEAVEIQDTILNAELTAKLRAQPTIPQESPRGLFGFRWGPSQFANLRRGDFRRAILPAPPERGRAQARRRTPSPDLLRRPPGPRGEGKPSLSGARTQDVTPPQALNRLGPET